MKKKRIVASILSGAIGLGAVATGIGFLLSRPATAIDFSNTQTYVSVGEVWNEDDKAFNQDNLRILMKYLTGNKNAKKSEVVALAQTPQKASELRKKVVASGVQGDKSYEAKSSSQNINITLGGLEWQVTYLSQDKNGNAILTLWLSNSTQDAFYGRAEDEGTHYGYVNGNLYSDWSNNWSSGSTAVAYPSAMYGTSYVRAVTLNNGGQYALNNTTLSAEFEKTSDSAFALFTIEDFGLTDYIVKPIDVAWQENQSSKTIQNTSYNYPNDAWGLQSDTGFYSAEYNYSEKEGYDTWKNDYIWLPSMAETGYTTSSSGGLWGLNVYQRMNYDGETLTDNFKVGTAKGAGYYDTFLRSGYSYSANNAYFLYPSGANNYGNVVSNSRSIRPSLHLNLSSAVLDTATREIQFEVNGGNEVGSMNLHVGERYLNLPTPVKAGEYFAGWYLDASLSTMVTGSSVVASGSGVITLYAKWESSGYEIHYVLEGGEASASPALVGAGAEITLPSATKRGYLFKGWLLGEGLSLSTAYYGTKGATTPVPEANFVAYNPSGGYLYFKDLAQAGGSIILTAVWEIDSNAKQYQILSYDQYFIDKDISSSTMKIYTISTASVLDEKTLNTYKNYDLIVCGNKYYYINSTEGFMYLTNYNLSKIDLANKVLELRTNVYVNEESYEENGTPVGGDGIVYQFSPLTKGSNMIFNGNGYSLSGVYYDNPEKANFAIFHCGNSTVESINDLYVDDFYIKVAQYAAVIGYNVNNITNCETRGGYFKCGGGYCGAIAYLPKKTATRCINFAPVYGGNQSAGLFYQLSNNVIIDSCINYGKVYGAWATAGVCSYPSSAKNITIKNTRNYGNIQGTSHVSGFIGIWYGQNAQFSDCGNYGVIDPLGSNGAGFCAYVEGRFDFDNCKSVGLIKNGSAFVHNIVTVNIKTSEQCYNFVNCYAKISGNNHFVSGGSPTYKTTIKMKNIKVDVERNNSYSGSLLSTKGANVTAEFENVEFNVKCYAFSGYVATAGGSFKNILFNVDATSYTARTHYLSASANNILSARGIVINLNTSNNQADIKQYYGNDFSAYFTDWKSGKTGIIALNSNGPFVGALTENNLISKGYTKKEI